jgi:hypothetical protein
MGITTKAYANCEQAYVVWRADSRIDGCHGAADAGRLSGRPGSPYATNIMAIYNQYRRRYSLLERDQSPTWNGLQDTDTWRAKYFTGAPLTELEVWLGQEQG